MRFIMLAPVPVPSMMGSSPSTVVATVISLGRTRSTAPWRMASSRSTAVVCGV